MKIRVSLGNISQGIAEIKEYQKSLEIKLTTLLKVLAELGVEEASYRFSTAKYDGINDVVVEEPYWKDDNTLILSAKGRAVTFIEFGAGVHYTEQHPLAEDMGAIRGEFGSKHGKNDYWFYTGQPGNAGGELAHGHKNTTITHGNPPSRAMYEAGKVMRQNILAKAKEIFKS